MFILQPNKEDIIIQEVFLFSPSCNHWKKKERTFDLNICTKYNFIVTCIKYAGCNNFHG